MKGRRGQVALYLVLVLVAICLLAVMNVGTFLGVSARNTTMNGGDAASLAAAVRLVMTFERGASRAMCAAEFDARTIYDAYVARVTALVQNS